MNGFAPVAASRDEAAEEFHASSARDRTIAAIETVARERGTTPEERLLAIFDVFDDWFHRDDFEPFSSINVMIEMGAAHPLGTASIEHPVNVRQIVTTLAEQANLREPAEFARSWQILMEGSIISASEGDTHAAKRSQNMACALIREHREVVGAARERFLGGSSAPAAVSENEDGADEDGTDEDGTDEDGTDEDGTAEQWTDWDDLFPTQKVSALCAVDREYDAFASDYGYDLP